MYSIFLRVQCLLLLFVYMGTQLFGTTPKSQTVKCLAETEYTESATSIVEKSDTGGVGKISSRLWELFLEPEDSLHKLRAGELLLYPGGSAFGLVIDEIGATVCGATAGKLLSGDRIVRINGIIVNDAKDVENATKSSGGRPLLIEAVRGNESIRTTLTPQLVDGEYQLGLTLRSTTAGIGTVTYVIPGSLEFGGLGHGVNDADGNCVTIEEGKATSVTLGGCKKGEHGHAGELTGVLGKTILGSIVSNTPCGVFGSLTTLPDYATEPIPAGKRSEVSLGDAEIISTVKNGKRQTYKIEITEIDYSSDGSKSFKIKVTDPALIALTGGIVRGMSGSPIIQNGKLVGAVTHVLVADPTEGYGIFIENMLEAAQQQVQPKAA